MATRNQRKKMYLYYDSKSLHIDYKILINYR